MMDTMAVVQAHNSAVLVHPAGSPVCNAFGMHHTQHAGTEARKEKLLPHATQLTQSPSLDCCIRWPFYHLMWKAGCIT